MVVILTSSVERAWWTWRSCRETSSACHRARALLRVAIRICTGYGLCSLCRVIQGWRTVRHFLPVWKQNFMVRLAPAPPTRLYCRTACRPDTFLCKFSSQIGDDFTPEIQFGYARLALAEKHGNELAVLVEDFQGGNDTVFGRFFCDPGAGNLVFTQVQVEC